MSLTRAADRTAVSSGWVRRYGLMFFGQNLSWSAPTQILLATQVLAFYPDDKELMLGWLMAAGGLASVLSGPIAGRLSDLTRARRGDRLPWLVGGTIASVLTLSVAGLANSYVVLVLAWVAFQVSLGCSMTSVQSIPPDRVPGDQYGLVSGVMGLTYTAAVVVAVAVAAALPVPAAYLTVGLLMAACLVPFAVQYVAEDSGGAAEEAVKEWSDNGFHLPSLRRASDFWWVFLARLLVTMAQCIGLFYLFYFLRDRIHYADPDTGVLILTAIYAAFVILTAVWSGRASDRTGKRRSFVSLSSFGVAIACIVMASATSFPVVVVAAALLGLSWGIFQAIDQALINHVLPSAEDRAAHIGIVNLAVTIPNTAAPAVAALLVTEVGGYPGLYGVSAALTIAGGLVVWKVRSVP